MSTNYRSTQAIPFAQLFDGRLEKYGVYETIQSDSTDRIRYLVGRDGVVRSIVVRDALWPSSRIPPAICHYLVKAVGRHQSAPAHEKSRKVSTLVKQKLYYFF